MFSHSQVHLSTFGLGDRDGVGDPVTEGAWAFGWRYFGKIRERWCYRGRNSWNVCMKWSYWWGNSRSERRRNWNWWM